MAGWFRCCRVDSRLSAGFLFPAFLLMIALFVPGTGRTATETKRYDVPILDSPQRGPADAPLTVIEFIDFQ